MRLNRVEFSMTFHCTGKCRHCSVGEEGAKEHPGHLSYEKMAGMLHTLSEQFPMTSVMCLGEEPLLYPADVCAVYREARESGIPQRQLITNGFFSREPEKIRRTVAQLADAGITELLLSVDAFHQETIPLEPVMAFTQALREDRRITVKLHPAWLVSPEDGNPYNAETRRILRRFAALDLPVSTGNVIFPSGNAEKYLSDYFEPQELDLTAPCGAALYTTRLDQVETLSILPDGGLCVCGFVIGNLYREPIKAIIERYDPFADGAMEAVLRGGVGQLRAFAQEQGLPAPERDYRSACDLCRAIAKAWNLRNA